MNIPEVFIDKVKRGFGEKGEKWLLEIPKILNLCIEKWNLTDCYPVEDLSVNLVCLAQSVDYGPVVLKIEGPHPEKYTEMKALSLYGGRNICKCYDLDMELGVLLLERITPGPNLTTLQDLDKQLMIAADLISKLPIEVNDTEGLPTYDDWINRAFKRARKEGKVGAQMLSLMESAEKLYQGLKVNHRPKVLLHGDLHHWNILQGKDGLWKAIDPQGVIGIPCMESARFINNQIDMVKESEKLEHLNKMLEVFASKFNETKGIIATCYFVHNVLSTCWTFEEANPDPKDLEKSIDKCQYIFDYIMNM